MKNKNMLLNKQTEKFTSYIIKKKKEFQNPIITTYKPLEIMSAFHSQVSALKF